MTRLAWRLHRWQILGTVGVAALAVLIMVVQRFRAAALVDGQGSPDCRGTLIGELPDCNGSILDQFHDTFGGYLLTMAFALLVLPVVVGLWCGAPLFAREFEQHTAGFALTQSVSRRRWYLTHLAVVGVPLLVSMTLVGLVSLWILMPMTNYMSVSVLSEGYYPAMGIVPAAIALSTFVPAATVGLLWRNTMAILAVGLVLAVGLGLGMAEVRAGFVPTEDRTTPFTEETMWGTESTPGGTWFIRTSYQDSTGADVTSRFDGACHSGDIEKILACAADVGVATVESRYHPPSHFWPLQLVETGLYLLLSAAVVAVGDRVLRRRDVS